MCAGTHVKISITVLVLLQILTHSLIFLVVLHSFTLFYLLSLLTQSVTIPLNNLVFTCFFLSSAQTYCYNTSPVVLEMLVPFRLCDLRDLFKKYRH